MGIELKTVMGQMNIVGGQWVSEAPNTLAVREPSARAWGGFSKGDLFVVVEVRGDGEGLGRSLAETIRNTYYQSSGSITASLRRALTAANRQLLQEASYQPSVNGLLGGATVAVVRGEDVFIASIGPAVTYAINRGHVTRFPEASPWLDLADAAATGAPALGRRATADMQLFHVRVEPGDMLVLGDSRFGMRVTPNRVEEAVAYQGVDGALTNLGRLAGGRDSTALVIEIQAKGRMDSAPSPAARAHQKDTPKPQTQPTVTVPRRQSRGTPALADMSKAVRRSTEGIRLNVPLGRWLRGLGKGLLALLMVVGTGLRTLIGRVLPGQEQKSSPPRPTATGQARPARGPQLPQRILRTVALSIPLIVLAAVVLTYWQRGLARESEFNGLVEQAQAAYQQSLNAEDAAARDLLSQAQALLTQANAIKAGEPVIDELSKSIAEQSDQINRVERLYWVGQLRTYDDPATLLRRVVVNGLDVYVLDTGADRVYHHRLDEVNDALEPDEGDPVMVQRGQQVETAVVGEMIDLVWMPAGGDRQTSDLLILESDGLLEYNPSWGLTTSPIVNTDAWALPIAVGSYFGNFYILDPQVGQILRYTPGAEGYTNPAQYYFPDGVEVDLSGAVDIAIDGFIYVLYADGTIHKFEGGVPVDFQITDIDQPLNRPVSIYAAPDDTAQFIYVADAGNGRVVQLNKDGRFIRQFKPRDEESIGLNALQSIFVDELSGKLYLLAGHSLYIANITPLQ